MMGVSDITIRPSTGMAKIESDADRAVSEVSTDAPADEAIEEVCEMADAIVTAHKQLAARLARVQSLHCTEAEQAPTCLAEHAQTFQKRMCELQSLEQQFHSDLVALQEALVTKCASGRSCTKGVGNDLKSVSLPVASGADDGADPKSVPTLVAARAAAGDGKDLKPTFVAAKAEEGDGEDLKGQPSPHVAASTEKEESQTKNNEKKDRDGARIDESVARPAAAKSWSDRARAAALVPTTQPRPVLKKAPTRARAQGKIVRIHSGGFGFIESRQAQIFFHMSVCEGFNIDEAKPGDRVNYLVATGADDRLRATSVRLGRA